MDRSIKIGYCVAYDWYLLRHSLPLVYEYADQICLSIDESRLSWSGLQYDFDEPAFQAFIKSIDVANKIKVVEENYHRPELTPMANEVRQRNMIAKHLGAGGWHIQLDCDEYFLEFANFVRCLQAMPAWEAKKANVCCAWLIVYKQVQAGFLIIDPVDQKNLEFMQIATTEPNYEYGRRNGNFNIYTNFRIVHQSWARSEAEIADKIRNWGHSNDFDTQAYFERWKSLTNENYQTATQLHPLIPALWPGIKYVAGASIDEFLERIEALHLPTYTRLELFLKNSRLVSKLKTLLGLT